MLLVEEAGLAREIKGGKNPWDAELVRLREKYGLGAEKIAGISAGTSDKGDSVIMIREQTDGDPVQRTPGTMRELVYTDTELHGITHAIEEDGRKAGDEIIGVLPGRDGYLDKTYAIKLAEPGERRNASRRPPPPETTSDGIHIKHSEVAVLRGSARIGMTREEIVTRLDAALAV